MSLDIVRKNSSSPFRLQRSIVEQDSEWSAYESSGFNPNMVYNNDAANSAIESLGKVIGAGLSSRTEGDKNKSNEKKAERLEKRSTRIEGKKDKAQTGTEIDWDKVREVNDNTAVQAAKIFDPTGITSWPDVYYAIDDYNKGKGSGSDIALSVLGALPVLGKLGKGAGFLAKSKKLAKAADKLSKLNKAVDKVEKIVPNVAKVIGNTSDIIARGSRAGKANPIAIATKVIGKVAKGVEKTDKVTRKVTGKVLEKIPGTSGDIGNIVDATTSFLNIGNIASDVKSTIYASNKNKQKNGGSLPGATGNMYARHGAPSKGPRRNQTDVTDASAQNGKEMQYYQNGLDWKPKSISRDGSGISTVTKTPLNQKNKIVEKGSYDKGKVEKYASKSAMMKHEKKETKSYEKKENKKPSPTKMKKC